MYKLMSHVIYDMETNTNKKYLIDIEKGSLFELNETAAILLESLIAGKSVKEYAELLKGCIKSDIDIEKIQNDADSYINVLIDGGYLTEEKDDE